MSGDTQRAAVIECVDDLDAINKLYRDRRWSDGLPIVPPTAQRVERMLRHARRPAEDVVAHVAPGFGAATVERIAINAVMAGCDPEYMPALIAAVEAVVERDFNLQGIQATTNPVATVSAMRLRLLMLNPSRYIAPNVPSSETSVATAGMMVARALRRNRYTTMKTAMTSRNLATLAPKWSEVEWSG